MNEIVNLLKLKNKTISTMESCTGGAVVNAITNVEGASEVLKFSAVTYSNEFKIKMGVSKDVIDKYTVYSENTAKEMSKNISLFTDSDYGVGITGKINRSDKQNLYGEDNVIYISIYDKNNEMYYTKKIMAIPGSREENKNRIIEEIIEYVKNGKLELIDIVKIFAYFSYFIKKNLISYDIKTIKSIFFNGMNISSLVSSYCDNVEDELDTIGIRRAIWRCRRYFKTFL